MNNIFTRTKNEEKQLNKLVELSDEILKEHPQLKKKQEKGFVKLITDLKEQSKTTDDKVNKKIDKIINRAISKDYSDFESEMAMPCTELLCDLKELSFDSMCKLSEFGDYDHGYVYLTTDVEQ